MKSTSKVIHCLDVLSGPFGRALIEGGTLHSVEVGMLWARRLAKLTACSLEDVLDIVGELHS